MNTVTDTTTLPALPAGAAPGPSRAAAPAPGWMGVWLDRLCAALDGVECAALLAAPASVPWHDATCAWPATATPETVGALVWLGRQAGTQRRSVDWMAVTPDTGAAQRCAFLFSLGGEWHGAVALQLKPRAGRSWPASVAAVEAVAAACLHDLIGARAAGSQAPGTPQPTTQTSAAAAPTRGADTARPARPAVPAAAVATATLDFKTVEAATADWRPTVTMVHAALSAGRLAPAAAALAEALRLAHRCERVSVGTVEAPGRATVVAVSPGADGVAGQSLMDALAGAMEECAQAGAPVVHPLPEGSPPRRVASHLALARRDGLAMALSVPLASGTDVQGVLLLERRTPPFSDKERKEVVRLATLLAPAWALLQTLEQPWWQRWTQQARQQWGRSPAGRRVAWAGGAAALLAGLTALAVVPVDQRVSAPAHIEGTVQRALVAPTDGYLLAAHVRPGDTVRAGDLLAEMAREEMELQARKWNGELAQAEAGAGSALAGRDRAALVVQQARVVEAQAQLALSRQHLARSQVHAPFDGVVIEGDLSRSLGAPLKRGDVLLRVSPTDAYRLVLDVDERDVAQLRVGAVGQVVLAAHPGQRWPLQVTRITPVAAVRDGRVGYEVEASLPIDQPMLRPGLTGVAKIDIGQTPLAGQWWRDVAARVRYWAWSLTG